MLVGAEHDVHVLGLDGCIERLGTPVPGLLVPQEPGGAPARQPEESPSPRPSSARADATTAEDPDVTTAVLKEVYDAFGAFHGQVEDDPLLMLYQSRRAAQRAWEATPEEFRPYLPGPEPLPDRETEPVVTAELGRVFARAARTSERKAATAPSSSSMGVRNTERSSTRSTPGAITSSTVTRSLGSHSAAYSKVRGTLTRSARSTSSTVPTPSHG